MLTIADKHRELVSNRRLDLSAILRPRRTIDRTNQYHPFSEGISAMNQQIVDDSLEAIEKNISVLLEYDISTADRAATATLSGILALRESNHLKDLLGANTVQTGHARLMSCQYGKNPIMPPSIFILRAVPGRALVLF